MEIPLVMDPQTGQINLTVLRSTRAVNRRPKEASNGVVNNSCLWKSNLKRSTLLL